MSNAKNLREYIVLLIERVIMHFIPVLLQIQGAE